MKSHNPLSEMQNDTNLRWPQQIGYYKVIQKIGNDSQLTDLRLSGSWHYIFNFALSVSISHLKANMLLEAGTTSGVTAIVTSCSDLNDRNYRFTLPEITKISITVTP